MYGFLLALKPTFFDKIFFVEKFPFDRLEPEVSSGVEEEAPPLTPRWAHHSPRSPCSHGNTDGVHVLWSGGGCEAPVYLLAVHSLSGLQHTDLSQKHRSHSSNV